MLKHFLLSLFVLALFHLGSSETGCPDDDLILPCKCTTSYINWNHLECKGVDNAEDLKQVFQNSERYTYQQVHIVSSTLQYLPHDLFEKVKVVELNLINVTLNQLFDSTPVALDHIWRFNMENTVLMRGVIWKLLEPMKNLFSLVIQYNNIKTLGKDFNQYAPKSLVDLRFYKTNTRSLAKGVFRNFPKLESIDITGSKLRELSRDIFDETFNGKELSFNENKISKISEDMFHKMPNIKSIMLRSNQLSGLPQSAFDGNFGNLLSIFLDGNPLKCDCLLQWMARDKPKYITGKCISPKRLNGRKLKDLKWGDFNC